METKSIKIQLAGDKEIILKFNELPSEIDVDRILRIDHANLSAEMATIPVLLNKVGLLLAELDNDLRISELVLKKEKAKIAEEARNTILQKKGKPATGDEVIEYVRMTASYDVFNRKLSKSQMKRDMMNSVYWSLKAKQEILQNLSKSISVGDFEESLVKSVMKTINYVEIRERTPLIK